MKVNHQLHTYAAYRTRFRTACLNGEVTIVAKVLSSIKKWKNIQYFFLPEEEGMMDEDEDGTVLHCACITNQVDIVIMLLMKLRSVTLEYEEDQSKNLFQSTVLFQNSKNLTIWDVCCMFEHNTIKSILLYFCPNYSNLMRSEFKLLPKYSSFYLKGKLQRYYYQSATSSIGSKLGYWYYNWYFQQEFEWKSFYQEYQSIYWIRWIIEFLPRWPYYSFCSCLLFTFLWSFLFYWLETNMNAYVYYHYMNFLCQGMLWYIISKLYAQKPITLPSYNNLFLTHRSSTYALEKYDTNLQAVIALIYSIAADEAFIRHQERFTRPSLLAITSLYLCHHCYRMKDTHEEHSYHAQCCLPEYDHFCYFLWLDIAKHNYVYFVAYLLLIAFAVIPSFFYCSIHFVHKVLSLSTSSSSIGEKLLEGEQSAWIVDTISFLLFSYLAWLCLMWIMVMYLLVYQWILYRYNMTSQEWKTAAFRKEYAPFLPSRHTFLTRLYAMK